MCAQVETVTPDAARIRVVRTVPNAAPMATPRFWQHRVPVLAWAGTELAPRVMAEAWKSHDVRLEVHDIGGAFARTAKIAHVIAVFDERSGGVGIRVTDASSGKSAKRIDRAESVRHRLPSAEMCIVQADLLVQDRRSEAGRQEAMLARRFAAELTLVGFPVVIVLPRLLPERAIAALRCLSAGGALAAGKRLDRDVLVDVVREMQREIARDATEETWEMACDVTLYCEPTWFTEIG